MIFGFPVFSRTAVFLSPPMCMTEIPAEEMMLRHRKKYKHSFLQLFRKFQAMFFPAIFYVFQDPYDRRQICLSDMKIPYFSAVVKYN